MLTPQEISGKEFVKAVFGGYDMSAVDDFLETLTADYSALYKENAILKSKIKVLVEKVEEYRSTEDSMRMALLTAQKMGEDIVTEAKEKSANIMTNAEENAKLKIKDMNDKIVDEEERLKAAEENTRKFVAASQEIMRQHAIFLSKLDGLKHSEQPAPAKTETAPEPMPEPVQESVPVQEKVPVQEPPEAVPEQETVEPAVFDDAAQPEAEPEAEPEQQPSKEDEIMNTAKEINSAVTKIIEDDDAAAGIVPSDTSSQDDDDEPTKLFRMKTDADWSDDDEPTSPRPKFDFDDLKFGSNYSKKP